MHSAVCFLGEMEHLVRKDKMGVQLAECTGLWMHPDRSPFLGLSLLLHTKDS
jgi:hypothetical protein